MIEPVISVVIPAYNEEKYLPRYLPTVLTSVARWEQVSGRTAEVLVVDNASDDATAATPEAEEIHLERDPCVVTASTKAGTSSYSTPQKTGYELISKTEHLTQFMNRDARPDFSSTMMPPAMQEFIPDPKGVDGLLTQIERQRKTIFARS
jgi:hypothetical protein